MVMNAVPRRVGCLPMCHVRVNRHRMAASNQYITKYTRKLVRSVVVIILFLSIFQLTRDTHDRINVEQWKSIRVRWILLRKHYEPQKQMESTEPIAPAD